MNQTPTTTFLALTATKSKEEISCIFLEHLKTIHPIPEDIKVTLTLSNKSEKSKISYAKGLPNLGSITMHRTGRTADITLFESKTRETPLLLKTLAHEYKHILQAFVDHTNTWGNTGKDSNIKEEVAAEIFGVFQSRKFCYGW